MSLRSPSLPIPVCFSLSIADNVPSGSEARISGTNVTLVRLEGILLVKHLPYFAFLPEFPAIFLQKLNKLRPCYGW